jgi:hypothetical protein
MRACWLPVARTKAVALAVVLALSVTACSGGDDDDAESTTTSVPKAAVALDVTRAELVSPHQAKAPLDDGVRDDVAGVVEDLLLVTSAEPLVAGKAGGGFADLFTPDAAARAANEDREVFFDEGVPAFGRLRPTTKTIEMTGLAGTDDPAAALVVARYAWTVESAANPGDRIVRTGELSLVPGGDGWRIGAYTIVVTRTIADTTTTTTAATG